ncbi:hypothetical protein HHK36_022180 [Tetracentron sinense]|uniref:Uncharacterized protein n=1 Tax=Tetracentron sinense TaxID=13715 RepID=A0A834YP22_TETSI|nr:hypothetical protein HHK36_022180 [Tetracentron sinense]
MDRDEHTKTRGRRRLAYEPLCLISAVASMEGYGPGGGVAGYGHVETLCCRSRTRIGSSPLGFSETKQSPPHLDLPKFPQESSSSQEDSLKQENGSSVCTVKLIPGHLENEEFNESEDVKDIEEEEVIWHLNESIRYSFSGMKEALGFTSHNMEILKQMDYSLEQRSNTKNNN